jgi:hypothetical protein
VANYADFYRAIDETFPLPPRKLGAATVYRHFDVDGRLLYIGCAVSPLSRQMGHAKKALFAVVVE